MTSGDPLLNARALVLRDLESRGLVDPKMVSLVEDCVAERRWWLSQWEQGAVFIDGLVAQDVQDALFDQSRRWPVCQTCPDPTVHSLSIEPELGPDPQWVCSETGEPVAPLGKLGPPVRSDDPGAF